MRVLCSCSYDGTLFHGFVSQVNLRTVQFEIEKALEIIHKEPVRIYASSRTDSGVHAIEQFFHFDTTLNIEAPNLLNAINSRLSKDVYLTSLKFVSDDFNSRFDAVAKEYHYLIDIGAYNPLYRNYRYYYPYAKKLDIPKMIEASQVLIGRHDFRSFTKNKNIDNTVRTIKELEVKIENNLIVMRILGDGFLHHMVRILVAMLLEVGIGKYTKDDLKRILEAKNRVLAPKIAPACGLYLYKIYY